MLHFNTNPGTPEQEAQVVDLDELWEKAHGETCPNGEIHDKIANAINNDARFKGVDKESRRPIVITGRKLISMGATLVSPKTGPWTHAIVHGSGCDKGFDDLTGRERAALSQLFGRLNGRKDPKDWGEWFVNGEVPKVKVWAPAVVKDIVLGAEKVNRHYADRATVEGAGAQAVINRDEYRTKMVQEYEERKKMRAPTRAEQEAADKEEKKQRDAAVKAARAIERLAKAEAKAAKDAEKEKTAPRTKVDNNETVIDGLLTQQEMDRLVGMFPRWAKATNETLIGQFMRAVDPDKVYTEQEFVELLKSCRNNKGKDMSKHKSHLMNIKAGTNGFGSIIKRDNNGYQLYPAMREAYKQGFVN